MHFTNISKTMCLIHQYLLKNFLLSVRVNVNAIFRLLCSNKSLLKAWNALDYVQILLLPMNNTR